MGNKAYVPSDSIECYRLSGLMHMHVAWPGPAGPCLRLDICKHMVTDTTVSAFAQVCHNVALACAATPQSRRGSRARVIQTPLARPWGQRRAQQLVSTLTDRQKGKSY
jgi:hypothetical protein